MVRVYINYEVKINDCWLCVSIIDRSNLERQLENLKTFGAEKYLQKNSLGNLLKIDQYFKKHLTL